MFDSLIWTAPGWSRVKPKNLRRDCCHRQLSATAAITVSSTSDSALPATPSRIWPYQVSTGPPRAPCSPQSGPVAVRRVDDPIERLPAAARPHFAEDSGGRVLAPARLGSGLTTGCAPARGKSGPKPALTRSGRPLPGTCPAHVPGGGEPDHPAGAAAHHTRRGLRVEPGTSRAATATGTGFPGPIVAGTGKAPPMLVRRTLPGSVVLGLAVLGSAAAGLPAVAAPTTIAPAPAAAGWLATRLVAGNHLETSFNGTSFPGQGLTADAVLAFDAAEVGQDAATRATTWLAGQVAAYVGDGTTESYAGAHGKLALVAEAQGLDPEAFGGRHLLTELRALLAPSGRFSDASQFGDFSNGFSQSLAVLALPRAGGCGAAGAAAGFLAHSQCSAGGFPLAFG